MIETTSDMVLIEMIRTGDESAFRMLIDRYRDRLVNFCVRYLGDPREGEDVAQDVCVTVYEKLNSFNGKSQFSTWLYRIAVNQCKNRHGSWWSRVKRHGKRASSVDRETSEIALVDEGDTPESIMRKSEVREMLMREISLLNPSYREVILLRDLEGYSYEEIAKMVGSSEGTVKSRLNRGRAQLLERVKEVQNELQ